MNRVGGCGVDLLKSGYGSLADACERGSEPSGFIKCREFVDCQE